MSPRALRVARLEASVGRLWWYCALVAVIHSMLLAVALWLAMRR